MRWNAEERGKIDGGRIFNLVFILDVYINCWRKKRTLIAFHCMSFPITTLIFVVLYDRFLWNLRWTMIRCSSARFWPRDATFSEWSWCSCDTRYSLPIYQSRPSYFHSFLSCYSQSIHSQICVIFCSLVGMWTRVRSSFRSLAIRASLHCEYWSSCCLGDERPGRCAGYVVGVRRA